MAHYTNDKGIACFWPDNTDTTLWVEATYSAMSLSDLLDRAKDHFGDFDPDKLLITPEHIHTSCLYYDAHDPMDWTHFIKLELDS